MKPKVILEIELDESKLPSDWQKYLEDFFRLMDGVLVPFGQETRKIIKIKKIEVKEK